MSNIVASNSDLKLVSNSENRFDHIVIDELSEIEKESLVSTALRIMEQKHRRDFSLTSPKATIEYLQLELGDSDAEVFGCVFLDNQHRAIATEELFQGTIDGASVYPREVVKRVLWYGSAAVIFFHNHPSGVTEPSQADIRITKRLSDALQLIDVRVLDHFIVSATSSLSFSERGLI